MNNNAVDFSNPSEVRKFFDSTQLGDSVIQNCKNWARALANRRYGLCVVYQEVMVAYDKAFKQFCGIEIEFKRTKRGIGFVECCLCVIVNEEKYPVAEFGANEYGDETVVWRVH